MKFSKLIIIVLVILIVVVIVFAAYSALTPASSSEWKSAATYPVQVADTYAVSGEQCVTTTVYITCVGGQDVALGPHNGVYTSSDTSTSSNNITSWTPDASLYPRTIYAQSCVASSGYIYCVGGTYDDAGDDVNSSYYATLSSDGVVGPWTSTTAYPVPVDSQYCVASSGYIYCVGGSSEYDGINASRALSNNVYYAPLSSSGIGGWSSSTSYPSDTYLPSCYAYNSYIYCLGGVDGNGSPLSTVYYAALSSAGVGTWTATTPYPVQEIGQACKIA